MEPKELYEKAKSLMKEGDFPTAIVRLNDLLLQRPGNKKALALRGETYLNAAEFQKAIVDLNKVRLDIDSADRNLWRVAQTSLWTSGFTRGLGEVSRELRPLL